MQDHRQTNSADYELSIARYSRFVRMGVAGRPSYEEMLSLVHVAGVESQAWAETAMLIDLRHVETPFSLAEQFRLGVEVAGSMLHLRKVASIVSTHRRTRVSERAARRFGSDLRVFDDEHAAVSWLYEEAPEQGPGTARGRLPGRAPSRSILRSA